MSRFVPKSVVCWREGFTWKSLFGDLIAGVTVGVIALPLAIAFGIASIPGEVASAANLSPPAAGLITAVVAGFLISALGGSRVQIGGPTAAFIVIVYNVAKTHGYDGLLLATLLAGVLIVAMGVLRFGAMIKFIPYPVTTGFTAGIAVSILTTQIKDFLGLSIPGDLPGEFVGKWHAYLEHFHTVNFQALGVGVMSLAVIVVLRRTAPRLPGAMIAIVLAASLVYGMSWTKADTNPTGVETIGSRFGSIPSTLPLPRLPKFSWELFQDVLPSAITIALLAAIESLLSAVVADGMTGFRHKADCELVAQGVANIASVLFGGIPATGAIARTTANIKNGARTPLAGMIHALTLLAIMLVAGPLAQHIPMAALAAVLLVVAWNISELDHFRSLLKAPQSDVAVLLTTFALTVFTDLTLAVGVGMVLASMLFIRRMAEVSNISAITREFENGDDAEELGQLKDPNSVDARVIPAGVEVYEINGPFFFGVADRLKDTLQQIEKPPRVFILRMRRVPAIDATGMHALREFHEKCHRQGTALVLSGVHAQPLFACMQAGLVDLVGSPNMTENLDLALDRAREILGLAATAHPPAAPPEVARETRKKE